MIDLDTDLLIMKQSTGPIQEADGIDTDDIR